MKIQNFTLNETIACFCHPERCTRSLRSPDSKKKADRAHAGSGCRRYSSGLHRTGGQCDCTDSSWTSRSVGVEHLLT